MRHKQHSRRRRNRRTFFNNMHRLLSKRRARTLALLHARSRTGGGGNTTLSLGYTGQSHSGVPTITNPFLGYTGKGGKACNASAPSNAADFLSFGQKGGFQGGCGCGVPDLGAKMMGGAPIGGSPAGSVTSNMLADAAVLNSSNGLMLTQQSGGAPAGSVTSAMLADAEVINASAPLIAAQQGGAPIRGGCGCGMPKMMGGAPIGSVTGNMLANAEVINASAPLIAAQQLGGAPIGGGGFPKPAEGANITLSNSGSVYPGSAPYLVTGGGTVDIAKAYPNTGVPGRTNWLNSQTLNGGRRKHKKKRTRRQRGGRNYGDLVPNGSTGTPWTGAIKDWPGVNGVPGDKNHFALNTYANDVSRQTMNVGANFPFNGLSWFGKGGSRGGSRSGSRRSKKGGSSFSNFFGQDLINVGRSLNYDATSAYNTLAGIKAPVNPLPWKDQLADVATKK